MAREQLQTKIEREAVDEILNRPGIQLQYIEWETDPDFEICPICRLPVRYWYITVVNSDLDYVESLQSHKCINCGFERFYLLD